MCGQSKVLVLDNRYLDCVNKLQCISLCESTIEIKYEPRFCWKDVLSVGTRMKFLCHFLSMSYST